MKTRLIRTALFLAVSILVEVFIFNARSFELIGCKSPAKSISISADKTLEKSEEGNDYLNFIIIGKDNIPADLRTLRIELSEDIQRIIKGSIEIKEKDFRWGHTRDIEIFPDVEHSQNVFIYQGHRVTEVSITLEKVKAQDITIIYNQPVTLRLNLLRLSLIFALLWLLWLLRPASPLYYIKLNFNDTSQKITLTALCLLFIAVLVFTVFSTYPSITDAFERGNQIPEEARWQNKAHYDMLTDALENHSFSLLLEPPAELAELVNPYDKQEREKNVPDTLWDAVYYKGKYYTYFGVTPVLTLLLPYKLLTGKYLLLDVAVLLYAIFGTLGLLYCYTWLVRRWFTEAPFLLYLMGAVMLFAGCGILWCARRPLVYETALGCAFCFSLCGLALNMSASRTNGSCSTGRAFFGCLLMALAVGARPTVFFATLLNIPVLLLPLLKSWRSTGKRILPTLIACAIPYLCVAAFLFYYNYARFGSIGEFGRNYQFSFIDASIYDNGLTLPSYLLGIVNFIIGSGFQLIDSFPFVKGGESLRLAFFGYKEFNSIFSASVFCPFLFILPFLVFIRNKLQARGNRFMLIFGLIIIIPCFLAGFSSSSAGMLQRYMLDFYWYIILAGILAAFLFAEWLTEKGSQKAAYLSFIFCLCVSIFFAVALSCGEQYNNSWFEDNNPQLFARINYFFSFWL